MAQYDLTAEANRITAAGGDPAALLTLDHVRMIGTTYYAFNRRSQDAADDLVIGLERTAAKKAAAVQMMEKVKAGKSLFTYDPRQGWTIVGPTAALVEGTLVEVTKANGETKTVRVGTVIATFSRGGVDYATATFAELPQARTATAPANGRCAGCGAYSTRLTVVADSSGVQGSCCPRCARLDQMERSFG